MFLWERASKLRKLLGADLGKLGTLADSLLFFLFLEHDGRIVELVYLVCEGFLGLFAGRIVSWKGGRFIFLVLSKEKEKNETS